MYASKATLSFLTEYYDAIEANDRERIARYYTDDIALTFANNPIIHGRETLLDTFTQILDRVQSLHHDVLNAYEEDDGVLIVETMGTWNLKDERHISVRAIDIFTAIEGCFAKHVMVVDNGPLFSALAEQA
ncbi:hypothetical protein BKA56DRAFT_624805 [Ilyonectria sp. MPI-CAGE-AT-0026]|nr:hypothetical protein BKA56DRAFT_624805 [Ilyonectria sp. MPI-CAGE-AT-0026]